MTTNQEQEGSWVEMNGDVCSGTIVPIENDDWLPKGRAPELKPLAVFAAGVEELAVTCLGPVGAYWYVRRDGTAVRRVPSQLNSSVLPPGTWQASLAIGIYRRHEEDN